MLLNVKMTLLTAANICIAWFGLGVWDLRSLHHAAGVPSMTVSNNSFFQTFLPEITGKYLGGFGRIYQGSHFLKLKPATPPLLWKVLGPDRFSRRQARRLCLVEQVFLANFFWCAPGKAPASTEPSVEKRKKACCFYELNPQVYKAFLGQLYMFDE